MEVENKKETHCSILSKDLSKGVFSQGRTIYKNKEYDLYIDYEELKIFLKGPNKKEKELSFKETVRFIDTLPEKHPHWKKDRILFIAAQLGFFGI